MGRAKDAIEEAGLITITKDQVLSRSYKILNHDSTPQARQTTEQAARGCEGGREDDIRSGDGLQAL